MRENRDAAMEVIFRHEGGYVDHPRDPGGATNLGITHKTLAAWRRKPVTRADVRALTKAEAREIYDREYWDPIRGDDLPAGVDLVVFDMGVNAGPARSARMLQEIVKVTQDGVIGAQTLAAVSQRDPAQIIESFSARRMTYYRSLKHWSTFGKGWSRRTNETMAAALDMARNRPVRVPTGGGDTAKAPEALTGFLAALTALIRSIFGGKP